MGSGKSHFILKQPVMRGTSQPGLISIRSNSTLPVQYREITHAIFIFSHHENNCFHTTTDVKFMMLIFNMKDLLMEGWYLMCTNWIKSSQRAEIFVLKAFEPLSYDYKCIPLNEKNISRFIIHWWEPEEILWVLINLTEIMYHRYVGRHSNNSAMSKAPKESQDS